MLGLICQRRQRTMLQTASQHRHAQLSLLQLGGNDVAQDGSTRLCRAIALPTGAAYRPCSAELTGSTSGSRHAAENLSAREQGSP